MTEFKTDTRHYCRYARCRSKLPAPVASPRDAFCAPGCRRAFFRRRCLVCERPMERKNERQKACGSRRCRAALRAGYRGSGYVIGPPKKPENKGPNGLPSSPRPWVQIAGPALTPNQLHCATIPDGPSGEYRRIEAKNRAALKAAEQAEIETNGYFTTPAWREVISPDGVRCYVTRFRPQEQPSDRTQRVPPPADLSIPPFLHRSRSLALGPGQPPAARRASEFAA